MLTGLTALINLLAFGNVCVSDFSFAIDFQYILKTEIVHMDPSVEVPLAVRDRYFRHPSHRHDCGTSRRVSSSFSSFCS